MAVFGRELCMEAKDLRDYLTERAEPGEQQDQQATDELSDRLSMAGFDDTCGTSASDAQAANPDQDQDQDQDQDPMVEAVNELFRSANEEHVAARTRSRRTGPRELAKDVTETLDRLRDNDASLAIFRLTELVGDDITTDDLHLIFDALVDNTSVWILHMQYQKHIATSGTIDKLITVLKQGRIWAANLGEWTRVRHEDWQRLIEAVPDTNLCFAYCPDPDHCGMSGEQKKDFFVKLRANRRRFTDWYTDRKQRAVAKKEEKMWWNPRSSKFIPIMEALDNIVDQVEGGRRSRRWISECVRDCE